jgi:hypothetical protein
MWTAIKWGFGIVLGMALAYLLFVVLLLGGLAALFAGSST